MPQAPPAPKLTGTPPPAPPARDWKAFATDEAIKQGVDPEQIHRIIQRESAWNPKAVSLKGAEGMMQLLPDTARSLGVTDSFDPEQNIRAGIRYYKKQWDAHKGKPNQSALALASYNAGPGAVERFKGVPPYRETINYVGAVDQPPSVELVADDVELVADDVELVEDDTPMGMGVAGPQALPGAGNVPGAIPNPQQFEMGTGERIKTELGAAFDPTDPSGRRNIAGAAGAGVAGALTMGMGALPVAALTMGGAAAGGALAETGEQVAGTKPFSPSNVGWAAGEQGLYEAMGQAFVWPIKAVGRRMIASPVGKAAQEHLVKVREATTAQLEGALTSAQGALKATQRKVGDTLHGVKEQALRETEAVRGHVRGAIAGVTATGRGLVESARSAAEGVAETAAAARRGPYEAMRGMPPPSPEAAGRMAQGVIEGPAKAARDRVGEAVEVAAKSGPIRNIRPLKAEALRILEREIKPGGTAFPKTATGDVPLSAGRPGGGARSISDKNLADMPAEIQAIIKAGQETEAQKLLSHPAMGVVSRILQAGDDVSFEAAHAFKRELDDALLGTADKVLNKRVTSLTQHLRNTLRTTMSGHKPYDEATAAYASIIPLYTKGYAQQLRKTATDDPGKIVRLLNPDEPVKAQMVRDLLVTQAAEGGDAAAGQAAWDSVRSAWTHRNLLNGGIETLGTRLEKVQGGEFAGVMFGDQSGKQVLDNLTQIHTAWQQAVTEGTLGVEKAVGAAKTMSAAAIEEARLQGAAALKSTRRLQRQGVREAELVGRAEVDAARVPVTAAAAAKRAGTATTPTEARFLASTVGPRAKGPEQVASDVLHATALGPGSVFGAMAWGRLLRGPKSADLLEWMAYSPQKTQLFVKAMTSPVLDLAAANLIRAAEAVVSRQGYNPLRGVPPPMPSHSRGGPPPSP